MSATPSRTAMLLDIEGTTTSLSFVHDTLFPIARRAMPGFIDAIFDDAAHAEAIATLRAAAAAEQRRSAAELGAADVAALLDRWMAEDRKDTILKALQGEIWHEAYAQGDLQSHVYPDVGPAMDRWKKQGLDVFIFSSGSVEAQRLLFGHTMDGDLRVFIEGYFDTTMGPKRDSETYRRIAARLNRATEQLQFLSDVTAELDAARAAGMHTVRLRRPGVAADPASTHPETTSFEEL